ncbi:hypothetical protein ACTMTU_12465 [Streptomyces sp. OZ13]|uniref:hypothetical protein n=1 Tax=Streptomyces sp. OZ13 TaxID=3452210 RepID=UPI003F8BE6D6
MNNGPTDDLGTEIGTDEDALRRLLHGVVEDIQPSAGALDHLRRAVPARRARKRQALVGAAAAALLIGTAVPAFVHSNGSGSANPVNAGHGEQAQGGTGNAPGVTGGDNGTKGPTQGTGPAVPPGPSTGANPPAAQPSGGGDGGSGAVQPPAVGEMQTCEAGQLSVSTETGAPDGEGKVYGTFRVTNVSTTDCIIGRSTIGFHTSGAADQARISVVRHVAGDAAGGLPDPSPSDTDVAVAMASASFAMKFAWVPSDTCPTAEPSPDPSPTEGDVSGGGGGQGGGTGDTGGSAAEPQLMTEDGVKEGSVTVTYSALGGGVYGQSLVPNACAGTIYHTGVLTGQ